MELNPHEESGISPVAPEVAQPQIKTAEEWAVEAEAARAQLYRVQDALASLDRSRGITGITMKLPEAPVPEPEEERRPALEYRYDPQSGTSIRTDHRGNPMTGGNSALRNRY